MKIWKWSFLKSNTLWVAKNTLSTAPRVEKFLVEKYGAADAVFKLKEEKDLMGGFVLKINDQEIDYSLKGRIHALQQKLIWR